MATKSGGHFPLVVCFLAGAGLAVIYIMRVNLSVAIISIEDDVEIPASMKGPLLYH